MLCDIVDSVVKFFNTAASSVGTDVLFFIALVVEALIVIFFLVKSMFSYEASLNRALEKINYWLFEKKVVSEDNIKELNALFKAKAPKRLLYFWQQYILFREGTPSSYLSTDNLIEKPLKTSSYNSNIKNLMLFTVLWAIVSGMFIMVSTSYSTYLTGETMVMAFLVPAFVFLIGVVFVVYLRARKNNVLNSLYQNTSLFGRFMDNSCIDLPSYIDYQILFTPQEIENGQPVLREFLDYKARKEKEEFNKAKENDVNVETYDFSSTGVDGSLVLDRAMKESELFMKKKEKVLLKISQLESELDSRKKNFDNVQKEYQTKIQASKENVDRLRQMQEETTNRIESNYYRKQQTQEIAKQEQFEQEFEQQRAKYMLEKNEGEEEIEKLNVELESYKNDVEYAMMSEYQTFFDKFCKSAEKVVGKVFEEKLNTLKDENEKNREQITMLEIKLKNAPISIENDPVFKGDFDEKGNFAYSDGTFYDREGNYHNQEGDVYSQDGNLISKAPEEETPKQVVDFDSFDSFDFMTDIAQKGDIYGVAEDIVNSVDNSFEVKNTTDRNDPLKERVIKDKSHIDEAENVNADENVTKDEGTSQSNAQTKETAPNMEEADFENRDVEPNNTAISAETPENLEEELKNVDVQPKKKVGRPKKVVTEEDALKPKKSRGRPRKTTTSSQPKRSVGRPKKIVKTPAEEGSQVKRGRGRPKKTDSMKEINQKLTEEEQKMNELRSNLNKDLQSAIGKINSMPVDDKKSRRDQLISEIDELQKEAQQVITNNEPESRISEINSKLETLLEEIKNLNS